MNFERFLRYLLPSVLVYGDILRLPACSKFYADFSSKRFGQAQCGNVLLKLKKISYKDCLLKCIAYNQCRSVNVSEKSSECELNSKDSRDANVTFDERDGWSFFETRNRPNENLGTHCRQVKPCWYGSCTDICEEPGYKCICEENYTGLNCDVGGWPRWPHEFTWSHAGSLPNMSCLRIQETSDPNSWDDNYLCWIQKPAWISPRLQWAEKGWVADMRCTQIYEGSDPHTWHDNYLCAPHESPYEFVWSNVGPISGKKCIQWAEPKEADYWQDNFLCA